MHTICSCNNWSKKFIKYILLFDFVQNIYPVIMYYLIVRFKLTINKRSTNHIFFLNGVRYGHLI